MSGPGVLLLALLFSAAAALLAGAGTAGSLRRLDRQPAAPRRSAGGRVAVVGIVPVAAVVLAQVAPSWVVAATVMLGTAAWTVVRHVRQADELRGADEVAGAAGTLSLLLTAGRIPNQALLEAAEDFDCLAAAAAAMRLGGEAPDALAASGRLAGHSGLATVSAAWRVCELTGAPVSEVMAQIVETLRTEREVGQIVEAELSAVRTSGRIMGLLPLVGIGLGVLVGADPLQFLLSDGLGGWFLLAAAALTALGVVWTERTATPKRVRPSQGRRR